MTDPLDKLDFALRRIYAGYLEKRSGVSASGADAALGSESPGYNLALRYQGDLADIEALGFATTWNEYEGFAHGDLRLEDLERVVSHPNVISLSYGEKRLPRLDHSALDILARAATVADIGTTGLWHVDNSTGVLALGSVRSGQGVVIGIIDTGIDVDHPVFMNSLSPFDTRILRIWDQGLDPDAAHGEVGPDTSLITSTRTYGVEFTSDMINDYLNHPVVRHFRHRDCQGHGTHVAAIAAGNGNPGDPLVGSRTFDFVGVAPKADIVMVKFLDVKETIKDTGHIEVADEVRFRDAIKYILEVAKTVPTTAKPAVINCSFGSNVGPHDGLTEGEQFLDQTFDSASTYHQGNIAVFAAGNDGDSRQHAKITIPASGEIIVPFELFDTRGPMRTEFRECRDQDNTDDMFVQIWYAEVTAPDDVSVAVRVPTETAFSSEVFSGFLTKRFDGNKKRTIFHQSNPTHRPIVGGSPVLVRRNSITLVVEASPLPSRQHRTGVYEIRIKGPAGLVLHAWTSNQTTLGFRVGNLTTLAADEATGAASLHVSDTANFTVGNEVIVSLDDGSQHRTTINSITAGAPGVFDIGSGLPSPAQQDRNVVRVLAPEIEVDDLHLINSEAGAKNVITVAAYDDNGDPADPTSTYGNIVFFSSRGPLVDYSGLGPYAVKPDIAAPGLSIMAARSHDLDGLLGNAVSVLMGDAFVEFHGTSMAAPHIAGVIALMLERKSTLTVDDVRSIFNTSTNVRPGTRPTPATVPDHQLAYGSGMVDATKAHDAVV